MGVTENQLNYIEILSNYDYTKEEDERDISNFLKSRSKSEINQLTKREASDLIQLLLKRPTGYLLPCDIIIVLDKREVNSFHVLSDIEACLDYCPENVYIGDCQKYQDYQAKIREYGEEEPTESESPTLIDFKDKKVIIISDRELYEPLLTNRQRFEKMVDDYIKSDETILSVSENEYRTEITQHYFLYWIKQKYDINNFTIYIKKDHCHLEKKI